MGDLKLLLCHYVLWKYTDGVMLHVAKRAIIHPWTEAKTIRLCSCNTLQVALGIQQVMDKVCRSSQGGMRGKPTACGSSHKPRTITLSASPSAQQTRGAADAERYLVVHSATEVAGASSTRNA